MRTADTQTRQGSGRGVLVAVVGPSGVGKDSLIAHAKRHFAGNQAVTFARRLITRPSDEAGENHIPVSVEDFERLAQSGAFAVSWQAHGLHYGIPASVFDDLAKGRIVLANGSRSALDAFEKAFPDLLIVNITARPDILATRLAARGRESRADIEARLSRTPDPLPPHLNVKTIDNSADLATASQHLITLLENLRNDRA